MELTQAQISEFISDITEFTQLTWDKEALSVQLRASSSFLKARNGKELFAFWIQALF